MRTCTSLGLQACHLPRSAPGMTPHIALQQARCARGQLGQMFSSSDRTPKITSRLRVASAQPPMGPRLIQMVSLPCFWNKGCSWSRVPVVLSIQSALPSIGRPASTARKPPVFGQGARHCGGRGAHHWGGCDGRFVGRRHRAAICRRQPQQTFATVPAAQAPSEAHFVQLLRM